MKGLPTRPSGARAEARGAAAGGGRCTSWSDVPDEFVRPGVRRRAFGNESCLIVLNECSPGMEPNPHSHDFEQLAMITAGRGVFHIGDQAHTVGPGTVMLIPAGAVHYLEPIGDEVVANVDIFAPARPDYLYLLSWMNEAAASESGGHVAGS